MFKIAGRSLGREQAPYIIAELSANHNGSIDAAKRAIFEAKRAGASAVKIQTYTPDTMTIDSDKPDFQITEGLWRGTSLYKLYESAYTPFEWHEELFSYASGEGITLFSSPFDETAVDLLESLSAPAYKIASFELVDLPLIRRVAQCGKPMLISTGMASLTEISEAVEVARRYGSGDLLLFHCISGYPAPINELCLENIGILRTKFCVEVGLSDHTLTNLAATTSIALGAVAVEKHFKPSNTLDGPDSSFSISESQLKSLVKDCNDVKKALGDGTFGRSEVESTSAKHRRSIYFVNDVNKGSIITRDDVRTIRPGFGLPPKYIDDIVGRKLNRDVERGDAVSWDVFC